MVYQQNLFSTCVGKILFSLYKIWVILPANSFFLEALPAINITPIIKKKQNSVSSVQNTIHLVWILPNFIPLAPVTQRLLDISWKVANSCEVLEFTNELEPGLILRYNSPSEQFLIKLDHILAFKNHCRMKLSVGRPSSNCRYRNSRNTNKNKQRSSSKITFLPCIGIVDPPLWLAVMRVTTSSWCDPNQA